MHRFCWRGRNRHVDRVRAGVELKDHLLELMNGHPDAEHHVIAHSHGGNVALYALRQGAGACDGVKVTTLGTPFLSMTKRLVSRGLLLVALLGITVFSFNTLDLLGRSWPLEQVVDWLLLLYYGGAMAGGILGIVFVVVSILAYRRGTSSGFWSLARGRSVDAESAEVSSHSIDADRLFVVRANGDEAAGLLGAAPLASWVLTKALAILRSRWVKWTVGLAFVAVAVIPEDGIAWEIVSWLCAGPMIAIYAVILLLAFAYLPFGIDMLFWTLHANVTAGPSPGGYGSGFQAGTASDGGLAHSVYNDPEVIAAVVDWVGNRLLREARSAADVGVSRSPAA